MRFSFILLIILISISVLYFQKYEEAKELYIKLENLNKTIENLEILNSELLNKLENLSIKYENLSYEYKRLEDLYSNLSLEYKNLTEQYNNLKSMYEILKKENEEYKKLAMYYEILHNLSLERHKFLSENFNYDFSSKPFIKTVKDKCLLENKLNLPCAINILKEKYSYKYISDKDDELSSVEEFINKKGGDCEDWSLFVSSLINYFVRNYKIDYIILYEQKIGYNFYLYKEGDIEYYYQDATSKNINLIEYKYQNIICYIRNQTEGHCIIALSNEYINPLNLNKVKAVLLEPQSGEYIGNLKEFLEKNIIYIIINELDIYYRQRGWNLWK